MQQQKSLYYREGSSDKEYHVTLEPKENQFVVNFAYGRRGSTLTTGTKTQSSVQYEEAVKIFSKAVTEKKAKGYTEGETGTPYQHSEKQSSGIACQLLNPIGEEEVLRLIDDDNWCMQEKFDGRRILIKKEGAAINGINRKGLLVGLPSSLIEPIQKINTDFILDGECIGETFHAFDILYLGNQSRMLEPYENRLGLLDMFLDEMPMKGIELVETAFQPADKLKLLNRLKRERKEGVVLKRIDAAYTAGRPHSGGTQLKHKFYATASVVVTKINQKRSVEIGVLNGEGWKSAGNVTIPPNHKIPPVGMPCEIRYLYAFKESGCLFQPTYLGPRSDVDPMECLCSQLKYKAGGSDER